MFAVGCILTYTSRVPLDVLGRKFAYNWTHFVNGLVYGLIVGWLGSILSDYVKLREEQTKMLEILVNGELRVDQTEPPRPDDVIKA